MGTWLFLLSGLSSIAKERRREAVRNLMVCAVDGTHLREIRMVPLSLGGKPDAPRIAWRSIPLDQVRAVERLDNEYGARPTVSGGDEMRTVVEHIGQEAATRIEAFLAAARGGRQRTLAAA